MSGAGGMMLTLDSFLPRTDWLGRRTQPPNQPRRGMAGSRS